jgi:hypothetical protein
MAAIDHRKTLKHLYAPSAKAAALVEMPPLRFLMIDGRGDPNTAPDYPVAVSALFTLAYTLKFALKRELGLDYAVMPLEGLWWAEDMGQFRLGQRDAWQWTMLIAQPEEVTAERLAAAGEAARKKVDASVLARVRLEAYHEGRCAQVLHRGPYAAEAPTIEALHAFIAAQGYVLAGKHHEIYLKDPQRTAPERLETVIRQPIAPATP